MKPTKALKTLCKEWVPFLQQKQSRWGVWKSGELNIGDSDRCMVGEVFYWNHLLYHICPDCTKFAYDLDKISVNNKSKHITAVQVDKMITLGNEFAIHYTSKHQ